MSDQPKPTDWTQESLRQYLAGYSSYDLQLKATASAHNVALAAEREEVRVMTNQCVQLRQELVAERQKHRKEMEAVTMNTSDIETVQQLRDQLAAEREKRENSDRKWIVATGQLRQQLADALAKIGAK